MTTPSGTTFPATNTMLLGRSYGVKLDWRCCRMAPEGFPVVSGRSGRTKSIMMSTGMVKGSRKLGGTRDSTHTRMRPFGHHMRTHTHACIHTNMHMHSYMRTHTCMHTGGLKVAYWLKHWTADRKVQGSSPTCSRDLFLSGCTQPYPKN